MTDIIVKIMVEVLVILGILTREITQGRMSMSFHVGLSAKIDPLSEKYLKELVGRKDVEDALARLDKLTQEETRIAEIEVLKITRGIDDKVNDVDEKLEVVEERVQTVYVKVEEVDEKVQSVDSKVQGIDHKLGSVIEGGFAYLSCSRTLC